MKLRTALTLAALAGLMSLPFAANAQDRPNQGRSDQHGRGASDNSRGGNRDSTPQRSSNQGHGDQQTHSGNQGHAPAPVRDDQRQRDDNQRKDDHRPAVPQTHDTARRNDWQQSDRSPVSSHGDGAWRPSGDRGWNSDHHFYRSDHNDWRDILFATGFVAELDILANDNRICFDGSVGEIYPIWQYDQDRASSDAECRARAEFFDHDYFYRDSVRFERRAITHNGERCYEFVRG